MAWAGPGLSLFLIGPVHAWHGLGWARLKPVLNWAGPGLAWLGLGQA